MIKIKIDRVRLRRLACKIAMKLGHSFMQRYENNLIIEPDKRQSREGEVAAWQLRASATP